MGRIVRRFARFYEMEMRGNYEAGAWGDGLEQYEAGQVLHSVVLNANALGGGAIAAYYGLLINADCAGVPRGLRVRTAVATGITVTGQQYGVHIETEILGTGIVTGSWEGFRVEMYAEAGTTINTVYGMFMTNFITSAPTGNYYFFRLSENGGVDIDAAFCIMPGGGSDCLNLFLLPQPMTAWSAVNDPPGGAQGRLLVSVSGIQKYIQLYN